MGDTYGAELRIRAVPRDWLMLERVARPEGASTTALEMRGWAQPWSAVEDDGVFILHSAAERLGPFPEDDAHELVDERNHRPLSEAWDRLVSEGVDWIDVDENADGTVDVTVVDAMASYGIAQWCDDGPGLDTLLMAAGLAFVMCDEGKYEIPGEARWWRPGLTEIGCAINVGSAGVVMARSEVIAIMRADPGDSVAIVAKVRERLDITDAQLKTADPERVVG